MKNKKSLLLLLVVGSSLLMPSCKKKDDPTPAPATPTIPSGSAPTITSSYYFQAKIDGTWVTLQNGVDGYLSGTASGGGTIPSAWQEEQNALIYNYSLGQGATFFILKTFTSAPSGSEVESMFSIKSYPYGKTPTSTLSSGLDGAGVSYIDANGVEWRTDNGTADQTGSTFKIVEDVLNIYGYAHKISKANFSCKLYDSAGNSKTLTNGVMRGYTAMY